MVNVGNRMIPLHVGEILEDGVWGCESEPVGVFVDRYEWAAKCEAEPNKFGIYDHCDPNTIYQPNPVVLETRALILIPCQAELAEKIAENKRRNAEIKAAVEAKAADA